MVQTERSTKRRSDDLIQGLALGLGRTPEGQSVCHLRYQDAFHQGGDCEGIRRMITAADPGDEPSGDASLGGNGSVLLMPLAIALKNQS